VAPAGKTEGIVTIRNVLLVAAVIFFVAAFATMPDGCAGYTSTDNVNWVCDDPSGVGETIGQAAHMLFAGLAILSAALIDHAALLGPLKDRLPGASTSPTRGA